MDTDIDTGMGADMNMGADADTDIGIEQYLADPCGTLSVPHWKARTMVIPDSIKIIHCRDWDGRCHDFQRYFRLKHSLKNLAPIDFDYNHMEADSSTRQLSEMINASYKHEKIVVSEEEILSWQNHETFREDLWICIRTCDGEMIASGIAEYDDVCREGILEWIQVLPEHRGKGFGKKMVTVLLNKLKGMGAEFVTVSGRLDNSSSPLELYRACGFEGNDTWYISKV